MSTIYVKLLNEGIDVWRPVEAEWLEAKTYRILVQPYDTEAEEWEFPPGSLVEAQERIFSGGVEGQVARCLAVPHPGA